MVKSGERGFVDRIKQIEYIVKDKTSAPTAATEELFLMCLIDDMDHCHVAIVDIPVAFMQADMKGDMVHMKMEGRMV